MDKEAEIKISLKQWKAFIKTISPSYVSSYYIKKYLEETFGIVDWHFGLTSGGPYDENRRGEVEFSSEKQALEWKIKYG